MRQKCIFGYIWPYYFISVAESDLVHMMSPIEPPAILKYRDESKDQNQVSSTRMFTFVGPYGVILNVPT